MMTPVPTGRAFRDLVRTVRHRDADDHPVSRLGSVLVGAGSLMVVAALGAFTPASPAAADVPAGTALITVAAELTPLNSGGSATPYGVLLPSGASCPGDTAHDGYLVYSYLVPAGVSPAAVSFKTGDPSKYYGYISQGSYYGAVNTAEDTGEIVGIPPEFTWSRLTPADLFPQGVQTATWDDGIACANTHGVVTNYWNSEIVFEASAKDPGGFTWRVVHPPAASSNAGSNLWLWVGATLIGLAVILGFTVLLFSRRDRRQVESSNHDAEIAKGSGIADSVTPTPHEEPDLSGSTVRR